VEPIDKATQKTICVDVLEGDSINSDENDLVCRVWLDVNKDSKVEITLCVDVAYNLTIELKDTSNPGNFERRKVNFSTSAEFGFGERKQGEDFYVVSASNVI